MLLFQHINIINELFYLFCTVLKSGAHLHLENLSIQTFQVLNRHMKGGCCFGQNSCGVKHQFVEQSEDRKVCYTQSKDAIIEDPECEKFFRTMIWFLSLEKSCKKKKAGGSKVGVSVTDFK